MFYPVRYGSGTNSPKIVGTQNGSRKADSL